MKVLVTGGAGYIGSHTIIELIKQGHQVISLDNFSNSDHYAFDAIKEITGQNVINFNIDLRNKQEVKQFIIDHNEMNAVIHFAALKSVEESVADPCLYYENNINGLINLLDAISGSSIQQFIFSSSCTVYGNQKELPVSEQSPIQDAVSPYGTTKLICEKILKDYSEHQKSLQTISLRYFNPAGAHESGLLGENPINPPKNLVPIVTEVAIGKRKELTVYGTDYNTRDGSCVRDYIHVSDLARAHTNCIKYLSDHHEISYDVFNIGIGQGATVLEIIQAFEQGTHQKIKYVLGERRSGDVEAIYSNYDKADKLLNWQPKYNLQDIMTSAWLWEKQKNRVYD